MKMYKIKPQKALALIAATTTLLVLGGCWDCPDCQPEKDIVYAWDVPESQDDCAAGTIYTDDTPEGGGDLVGTGIVDRVGTGIVDRDGNLVVKYCKRPCAGGEIPGPTTYMIWSNPNDFVEAGTNCEAP
jgi:hypothetical protein